MDTKTNGGITHESLEYCKQFCLCMTNNMADTVRGIGSIKPVNIVERHVTFRFWITEIQLPVGTSKVDAFLY